MKYYQWKIDKLKNSNTISFKLKDTAATFSTGKNSKARIKPTYATLKLTVY